MDVAEISDRLSAEGLDPGSWANGPGDRYSPHAHDYDKVLACTAGSIRFGLPARGITVDIVPGDRLELPAGTRHDAIAGPAGVSMLEAHLPAGSLEEPRRRSAGTW